EIEWDELGFRFMPGLDGLRALSGTTLRHRRRIKRLIRLLLRRGLPYYRALRVIEMIGYYARYRSILAGSDIKLVVMSSHSNPHGIAVNIAARRCGIPVALITHGMPVRPVAKLHYDLVQVHCEDARMSYIDAGCKLGDVYIHGRRQA